MCYANGEGVDKDAAEAVKWIRKAAEQGDVWAQRNLSASYANGVGVPKDVTEAVKWVRKAAEQGDAEAQYMLGLCYAKGEGVPKDAAEAVKWVRKAAEQGRNTCLVCAMRKGRASRATTTKPRSGFAKPPIKGLRQRKNCKVAESGDTEAQYNLGAFYYNGVGVAAYMVKAVKWFRKAAEQGNKQAQRALANIGD